MPIANYRAPLYEPTVDELETLKKLEMGEEVSLWSAAREHVSRRLLERGLVEQGADKQWHITAQGRELIRRAL
jgi:predicted transcriptional regulator